MPVLVFQSLCNEFQMLVVDIRLPPEFVSNLEGPATAHARRRGAGAHRTQALQLLRQAPCACAFLPNRKAASEAKVLTVAEVVQREVWVAPP